MTDPENLSFSDIRSSRSLFSSKQLSALSLRRHSLCKSMSSFVRINNRRSWRPPSSILHSITRYYTHGPPLAFAVANPEVRLFVERTEGVAFAGYAVMPCVTGERYVPARGEGGLVEDDHPRAGPSTTLDEELEGEGEEVRPFYWFSSPEAAEGRGYTPASGHHYPYTGHPLRSERLPLAGPSRRRDPDHFDRDLAEENDPSAVNGDGGEVMHAAARTFAARCWRHCGEEELLFSVSLTCASTKALHLAMLSVWWLSRYHGVSLRLMGMWNNDQVTVFSMLRHLLTITELHCVRCSLTAEWMQAISTCGDLTSLSIVACIAGGKGVTLVYIDSILSSSVVEGRREHSKWYLAGTLSVGLLKKLKCLHISHTPVQQDFIELLESCTNLECILLHRCKGVESLQPLTKLPKLRCVSLQNSSIKNDGVEPLERCTRLQHLYLIECRRLTHLCFLRGLGGSLRLLNLSQNYFSDEHMQQIANCTQLVELYLNSLKRLTNVNYLQSLRQLEVLSLSDNAVMDSGCAVLLEMQLTRVDLSRSTNLTSVGSWITLGSELVSLDLSGSGVTAKGLSALSAYKGLRYLNLAECARLDSIAFIEPLTGLRWLSLAGTTLTDAEARHLSCLTLLRYLSLKDCECLRELDFVVPLTVLEYLDLENTSLSDACIPRLAGCLALRRLNLSRCFALTDVTGLGALPALKELHLSHTSLTDAGMGRLRECPALEVLQLRSCRRLRSLTGLHSLPALRELNLDYYSTLDEPGPSFGAPSQRPSSLSGLASSQHTGRSQRMGSGKGDGGGETAAAELLSSSTLGALSQTASTLATEELSSPSSGRRPSGDSTRPAAAAFLAIPLPPAPEADGEGAGEKEEESEREGAPTPRAALPALLVCSLRKGVLGEAQLAGLLGAAAGLTRVDLSDCRHLPGLAALQGLPALREVVAANAGLSNAAVAALAGCPALERLSLAGCEGLTDLSALGRLRGLRVLDAARTHLSDAGLAGLAACERLVFLSLARCAGITDVAPLAALQELQELHLESTGVTTAGVARLARCAALRRLFFTRCRRLTSVDALQAALRQLDVLEVYGTSVPHRIARRPQPAGCIVM